jgi:hypothetical protein
MSTPQTATFTIDVPYIGQDGTPSVRQCVLTLSLSIADPVTSCYYGEEGFGEITVQGPVMPVDDHPQGFLAGNEQPSGDAPLELKKAA